MLSVTQIRALKPALKPHKVADRDGLFLLVQPSGALLWRYRFRHCGIERKLSLGRFPTVSLQQARRLFEEAQAKVEDGIDPVEEKRERKIAAELAARTTFGLVAEEYIKWSGKAAHRLPSRKPAGSWSCLTILPTGRSPRSRRTNNWQP